MKGYEPNFLYLDYVKSNVVNGEEKTVKSFGNAPGKSTQMSYFGRLSYSYDIGTIFRRTSAPMHSTLQNCRLKNRWGYFPSFSAGWTVSNEEFFADIADQGVFSFLKLRGSWGQNGNISVLRDYKYSTTINYNGSWYQYGVDDPAPTYGSAPSGLANPDLKWETSEQLDFGVDMRFLNSKACFFCRLL